MLAQFVGLASPVRRAVARLHAELSAALTAKPAPVTAGRIHTIPIRQARTHTVHSEKILPAIRVGTSRRGAKDRVPRLPLRHVSFTQHRRAAGAATQEHRGKGQQWRGGPSDLSCPGHRATRCGVRRGQRGPPAAPTGGSQRTHQHQVEIRHIGCHLQHEYHHQHPRRGRQPKHRSYRDGEQGANIAVSPGIACQAAVIPPRAAPLPANP